MAWTSVLCVQAGNTAENWTITGDALSRHDCIVVGPSSGNSGLRIVRKTVYRSPKRYVVRVRVIGAGAMAFRFYGEQMN